MAKEVKRYYYKTLDGKGYLNLKTPLDADELAGYVEITKEEFDAFVKAQEEAAQAAVEGEE